MDIQYLSADLSQARVQEEAAVRLQAMMIQNERNASEDLDRLMESSRAISDPNQGNYLNIFM